MRPRKSRDVEAKWTYLKLRCIERLNPSRPFLWGLPNLLIALGDIRTALDSGSDISALRVALAALRAESCACTLLATDGAFGFAQANVGTQRDSPNRRHHSDYAMDDSYWLGIPEEP
jgi:hypothetical protein